MIFIKNTNCEYGVHRWVFEDPKRTCQDCGLVEVLVPSEFAPIYGNVQNQNEQ